LRLFFRIPSIFMYLCRVKKVLQAVSIALTLFTFVGSVGVGVFTHFCHKDGVEQSYILPLNHCSEEKVEVSSCCAHEVKVQESDCCSDQMELIQLDFEQYESSSLFSFAPAILQHHFEFALAKEDIVIDATPVAFANPPPKRSARQILIENQVYRI